MLLGILAALFAGVIVAGGVLVFGHMAQGRRDKDDINTAFAEARGEELDPDTGPAPWSSVDIAELCEHGVVTIDRSDPYATLSGANPSVPWGDSSTENSADPIAAEAGAEPLVAQVAADPIVLDEDAADSESDNGAAVYADNRTDKWVEHAADSILLDDDAADSWSENGAAVYAENRADSWPERAADATLYDQDRADLFADSGGDAWAESVADKWVGYGAEPAAPAHEPVPSSREPIPNVPEPVPSGLAPAPADDRPVVWQAPAESSVIILVVALRALADGVAATLAADGRMHLEEVEHAVAQTRAGTVDRETRRGRLSSIDVDGHERSATWNAAGSSEGWDNEPPRRPALPRRPRRPSEPDRIAWRAPGELTRRRH